MADNLAAQLIAGSRRMNLMKEEIRMVVSLLFTTIERQGDSLLQVQELRQFDVNERNKRGVWIVHYSRRDAFVCFSPNIEGSYGTITYKYYFGTLAPDDRDHREVYPSGLYGVEGVHEALPDLVGGVLGRFLSVRTALQPLFRAGL